MTATPPPDWYTDPEDPSKQRWWDGSKWTNADRPTPPGATSGPTPPPPPPGYVPFDPQGSGGSRFAGKSARASWALAASIVGLLCCGPLSIVGLVIGRQEVSNIDAGRSDPSKRGMAQAAFIVGVIGVSLWIILLIARGTGNLDL